MIIRKQADGDIRVTMSDDELFNMLDVESNGDAGRLISDSASVKAISIVGAGVEIIWSED